MSTIKILKGRDVFALLRVSRVIRSFIVVINTLKFHVLISRLLHTIVIMFILLNVCIIENGIRVLETKLKMVSCLTG